MIQLNKNLLVFSAIAGLFLNSVVGSSAFAVKVDHKGGPLARVARELHAEKKLKGGILLAQDKQEGQLHSGSGKKRSDAQSSLGALGSFSSSGQENASSSAASKRF